MQTCAERMMMSLTPSIMPAKLRLIQKQHVFTVGHNIWLYIDEKNLTEYFLCKKESRDFFNFETEFIFHSNEKEKKSSNYDMRELFTVTKNKFETTKVFSVQR